jgi:hypothetical protein
MPTLRRLLAALAAALALVLGAPAVPAGANHSWGGYHWARRTPTFTLKLGDNVSRLWDPYLLGAASDWTRSSVLDTTVVPGATPSVRQCGANAGRVEVCNGPFGSTGWLGIAQIWVTGSHITEGAVKMNDTYFNTPTYNTPAWRTTVMCQEVAHTLGLDHQDEDRTNANLGTCMDYTNNPSTNQHPNQHDYDELETIYSHVDSTSTVGSSAATAASRAEGGGGAAEWGRVVRNARDGRPSLLVRDVSSRERLFTFVVWAE